MTAGFLTDAPPRLTFAVVDPRGDADASLKACEPYLVLQAQSSRRAAAAPRELARFDRSTPELLNAAGTLDVVRVFHRMVACIGWSTFARQPELVDDLLTSLALLELVRHSPPGLLTKIAPLAAEAVGEPLGALACVTE